MRGTRCQGPETGLALLGEEWSRREARAEWAGCRWFRMRDAEGSARSAMVVVVFAAAT